MELCFFLWAKKGLEKGQRKKTKGNMTLKIIFFLFFDLWKNLALEDFVFFVFLFFISFFVPTNRKKKKKKKKKNNLQKKKRERKKKK